jgi:hypothetical protein
MNAKVFNGGQNIYAEVAFKTSVILLINLTFFINDHKETHLKF